MFDNIKYYEIEFDTEPRNSENWDGDCVGQYSICILGIRKPTFAEAAQFCKSDMEKWGSKYVVNVKRISQLEARTYFDMDREKDFPVFGKTA